MSSRTFLLAMAIALLAAPASAGRLGIDETGARRTTYWTSVGPTSTSIVAGGRLTTDTTNRHIRGQYADFADLLNRDRPNRRTRNRTGPYLLAAEQEGPRVHLNSRNGGASPIPEPSSALLFGVGALIAFRGTRRSR